MMVLKKLIAEFDNSEGNEFWYNKLQLVKLRTLCSGDGLKDAKDYIDNLESFKQPTVSVVLGIVSEEYARELMREFGILHYLISFRRQ